MRRILFILVIGTALAAFPTTESNAQTRTFGEGSLIIPMDLDYQDHHMFLAFGLVYQLLLDDITIYWVIDPEKEIWAPDEGEEDEEPPAICADFVASAIDVEREYEVEAHGYRGGPFVIDASQGVAALEIIEPWQAEHIPDSVADDDGIENYGTVVHQASDPFDGFVSRTLTVAPTIAIIVDDKEEIAFRYLNAAAIPDSLGQAWPDGHNYEGYQDLLSYDDLRGPTTESTTDGGLFDEDGLPVYCQLMTMHLKEEDRDEDVVAEIRSFLAYPVHFFAECQAVNTIENGVNGYFLTPNGYDRDNTRPPAIEVINHHLPFAQFDGRFETVTGSEARYSLRPENPDYPDETEYVDEGVVMISEVLTEIGEYDLWMTGYIDSICVIDPKEPEEICESAAGKVSYLGGHQYSTETPISEHPDAQGTRLFLNALFEADCVTTAGQPAFELAIDAPVWTLEPELDLDISVSNDGEGVALDLELTYELPPNSSFVSATPSPTDELDGSLMWDLGNMGPDSIDSIGVTIDLAEYGTYDNQASLDYRVGLNTRTVTSNVATTDYLAEPPPDDTIGDGLDAGGGDTPDLQNDPNNGGDGDDTSSAVDSDETDTSEGSHDGDDLYMDGSSTDSTVTTPTSTAGSTSEEDCGCTSSTGSGDLWPCAIVMLLVVRRRRRAARV